MDEILSQLRKAGVHIIKSESAIFLEIKESEIQYPHKIDTLIFKLLMELEELIQQKVVLQCPRNLLEKLGNVRKLMIVQGERVIYTKPFSDTLIIPPYSFEVWPAYDEQSISFLAETMNVNDQEAKAFLQGMKEELSSQVDNMFTVYLINGEPAGLVFPHIEPDTDREGRMFWIGMHPNFIGKGLGKNLHLIGLYRLQKDFTAKTYLGSTQIENLPMRNIMMSNGCQEKMTVVSLKYMKNT